MRGTLFASVALALLGQCGPGPVTVTLSSGGKVACGVRFVRCLAVMALMALMPSLAHAQSSITGTIRDASGAVLPGVTVEAASPVLIEKVRCHRQRRHGQATASPNSCPAPTA